MIRFRDNTGDSTYFTVCVVTFFLIIGFIVFPKIIKNEDPLDILKASLIKEGLVPREDVYYVVDSRTHRITIKNKNGED